MENTYVIAEAGVNHNGRLNLALDLVQKASEIGVDCIKFQTFQAKNIVTKSSPKAKYQLGVTDPQESQFEMLRKLELGYDDYVKIIEECRNRNIDFLSTPYNFQDVDFLDDLGVSAYKIASGQLTELSFLRYVARKNRRMIISTGMGTMSDVFSAVEAIRTSGNNDVIVLQCTTNYPSLIEDSNVRAMNSIKEACQVDVGYSCHVENNFACFAAVALGAKVIEKHFTLDRNMSGPDHSSSLDPDGFKDLITGIRQIEKSLGNGLKMPSSKELENEYGMKRSLVSNKNLQKGHVLKTEDIGFKRPMNGLAPFYYEKIIGKRLCRDILMDEPFQLNTIEW